VPIEEKIFRSDEDMLKSLNGSDYLVVMDENGKHVTSVELSQLFEKHMNIATKN